MAFGHVILRIARKGTPFSPSMVATTEHVAKAIGVLFRQAKVREAIERSQKMEMVSQVTRSVAHSFNGILSTVLLSSQSLRKGAREHDEIARCGRSPCGEDAKTRFDSIDAAAKEGLAIVERLGSWARLGRGEAESLTSASLPAKVLFEEAWGYASPVWSNRVQTRPLEMQWRCPDEIPNVLGNSAELREVLLNLILNAIDAMPKGGVLTLGMKADGEAVVFSVQDTGTGIDPEIIERIFDPMFSTKGSAGAGLGLSLARSVAERHGGSLDVESTDGVGSCFRLSIPVASELLAAGTPGDADRPDSHQPASGARLLLVEPSELVRDVMVRALQSSGFDIDVVSDLDEAEVMLGARSGYAGLIADAAAYRPRVESFLKHVQEDHTELEGRVVLLEWRPSCRHA
jgi:signal transduction histidine kinase